jgi:hypothetical protein
MEEMRQGVQSDDTGLEKAGLWSLSHIKGIAAKTDSSWAKLFREAGREWSLKSATDPYSFRVTTLG